MGIYDREYYRDGSSSFLGTLARQGIVWKWLVAANFIAFVFQLATAEHEIYGWFTHWLWLDPEKVMRGEVWRLLTGAFLHSFDWQHVFFNMLILWWAGSEVEDVYGPKEFLSFYLAAALLSSAAYVLWAVLTGSRSPALGASGAVTAVLVLFAMHYPTRVVYVMFILPVPVILLVALYVLYDAVGLLGGRPGVRIGFAAHLGGAAVGFLYYKLQWRFSGLLPTNWAWKLRRPRPRLRVYRGEAEPERVTVTTASPRPMPDSQLEAELDAVLEKVARHGKSSLTEHEQQVLLRASEIYRQRRK